MCFSSKQVFLDAALYSWRYKDLENLKEIKRVFAAELSALEVVRDNLGQDVDPVISELASAKGKLS